MKDGLLKNTGNSRRIFTEASILPESYAEFREMFTGSGLPIDLLFNPEGWDVLGTMLDKATLFTDATAALYGLTGDAATPNNAFNLLGAVAQCSTAGGTAAKVVEQPGFTRAIGSLVRVKFSAVNSAATPTLNVNGTGAAAVRYGNGNLTNPNMIYAAVPHLFVFDGSYWQLLNPYISEYTFHATGSYTGDGAASRAIYVGFRPTAVLVVEATPYGNARFNNHSGFALSSSPAKSGSGDPGFGETVTITSSGFTVYYVSTGNGNSERMTNDSYRIYNWMAWR